MATIQGIQAREILDSRGVPTVECMLWLDSGIVVTSSVPSGTSKGKYEAVELRDQDDTHFNGLGVLTAVDHINTIIAPQLIGQDPQQQATLDQKLIELDGTPNKSNLGANAILAVSQAILKAAALVANVPLYYYIFQAYKLTPSLGIPTCIYTVINGGQHGADNLDIQEFQLIPASHLDFMSSLNLATTLFKRLGEVLVAKGAIHSVGLVGGYAPNLFNNTDAFEILVETIKASPYTFAQDVFFGVDMAAAEFHQGGKYRLKDKSQPFTASELIEYYKSMRTLFHVFYIEDPFDDDDLTSWKTLTTELHDNSLIVGDSILATNQTKVATAVAEKWCNSILIKPNQVGTISETIEVIKTAREAGWQIVMSHRSGETNDSFIADFAVGVGADYVKFGPPNRGERVEKYNRLLAINKELNAATQTSASATATNSEISSQTATQSQTSLETTGTTSSV